MCFLRNIENLQRELDMSAQRFTNIVSQSISPNFVQPKVNVDTTLTLSFLTDPYNP